jgi:hypothetical protein
MTRDEFIALPASVALGLLWDKSAGMREALEKTPAPAIPRPPRFDQAIYRKGGVTWASEYALEGLQFWQGKYSESAERGGEYAEMDAKRVKQLGYWIAWRRCEPAAAWSGERNRQHVTASAPSAKPLVYEREARRPESHAPAYAAPGGSFDENEDPFGDTEDPPF